MSRKSGSRGCLYAKTDLTVGPEWGTCRPRHLCQGQDPASEEQWLPPAPPRAARREQGSVTAAPAMFGSVWQSSIVRWLRLLVCMCVCACVGVCVDAGSRSWGRRHCSLSTLPGRRKRLKEAPGGLACFGEQVVWGARHMGDGMPPADESHKGQRGDRHVHKGHRHTATLSCILPPCVSRGVTPLPPASRLISLSHSPPIRSVPPVSFCAAPHGTPPIHTMMFPDIAQARPDLMA